MAEDDAAAAEQWLWRASAVAQQAEQDPGAELERLDWDPLVYSMK